MTYDPETAHLHNRRWWRVRWQRWRNGCTGIRVCALLLRIEAWLFEQLGEEAQEERLRADALLEQAKRAR